MFQSMSRDANQAAIHEVDFTPLLGHWVNLNRDTHYLLEMDLYRLDEEYRLRALGSGSPTPLDWGEAPARVFAADGLKQALGFHARFEIGGVEVYLAANINQGICVLQTYTNFHDGSGRVNHFSKEYFRRRETQPS